MKSHKVSLIPIIVIFVVIMVAIFLSSNSTTGQVSGGSVGKEDGSKDNPGLLVPPGTCTCNCKAGDKAKLGNDCSLSTSSICSGSCVCVKQEDSFRDTFDRVVGNVVGLISGNGYLGERTQEYDATCIPKK